MKILLIGNLAEDRQESMQRFTALLQAGLRSRGHEVSVLAPRLRLARFGPRYRYGGVPKYLGYFDKFVLFPRELRSALRADRPDVVHFTDHAGAVYVSSALDLPTIATCHDLLQIRAARGELPHQSVGTAGRDYQRWICSSLSRVQRVACVSQATRADALRLTGLPESRVPLVPNALNYPYQPIAVDVARERLVALAARNQFDPAQLHASTGFLLQVGGDQWYKNRDGLLAIVAHLRTQLSPRPKLVMVGPPLSPAQAASAQQLGLEGELLVLSGVTNAELEALYTLSEGLLFPSWAEGFGWPIAEAQACGCPVFATDRAPMNEVGGRSSVYFDPGEPALAARLIAQAWSGRAARRSLALAEASRWQPAQMFAAYESVYTETLR
jgi:glycosyltransferase involved in cell wall biosynthesis